MSNSPATTACAAVEAIAENWAKEMHDSDNDDLPGLCDDVESAIDALERQGKLFVKYLDSHDELTPRKEAEAVAGGCLYAAARVLAIPCSGGEAARRADKGVNTMHRYCSHIKTLLGEDLTTGDAPDPDEFEYLVDEASAFNILLHSDYSVVNLLNGDIALA